MTLDDRSKRDIKARINLVKIAFGRKQSEEFLLKAKILV